MITTTIPVYAVGGAEVLFSSSGWTLIELPDNDSLPAAHDCSQGEVVFANLLVPIPVETAKGIPAAALRRQTRAAALTVDDRVYSVKLEKTSTSLFLGALTKQRRNRSATVDATMLAFVGTLRSTMILQQPAECYIDAMFTPISRWLGFMQAGPRPHVLLQPGLTESDWGNLAQCKTAESLSSHPPQALIQCLLRDHYFVETSPRFWHAVNVDALNQFALDLLHAIRRAASDPLRFTLTEISLQFPLLLPVHVLTQLLLLSSCVLISEGKQLHDDSQAYFSLRVSKVFQNLILVRLYRLQSATKNGYFTNDDLKQAVEGVVDTLRQKVPPELLTVDSQSDLQMGTTEGPLARMGEKLSGASVPSYLATAVRAIETAGAPPVWFHPCKLTDCLIPLVSSRGKPTGNYVFLPHVALPFSPFERLLRLFKLQPVWRDDALRMFMDTLPRRFCPSWPTYSQLCADYLVGSGSTPDGIALWREINLLAPVIG